MTFFALQLSDDLTLEIRQPISQTASTSYHFDDVLVDRENFCIRKGEQTRALTPRAFDLLVYLIEHRNRVIEKRELFEQIWQETFVTDNALTRAIKDIRRVIGDNARSPRYIETVPKRGYRLIADVEQMASTTELILEKAPVQAFDALAVLPFANLNADPEQDYFADGMTDFLIAQLSKIRALRVISRTSVMRYKGTRKSLPEIARDLKVNVVVEGSVLRVDERVRITVQLIEVSTDRHLWADSYERELCDILALQSEVAQAIAQEIKITLTPQEKIRLASTHSVDPEAHLAYLKGCYFLNKYSCQSASKAIEYFRFAIETEPRYAAPYAGLAHAHGTLGFWGFAPPGEVILKAKAAVLKAIEIDDALGEAHSGLAQLSFYYDWDWIAAEKEFKRALDLNPGDTLARTAYSLYLVAMGRVNEGMLEIRRAWDLDPLSLIVNAVVGWHFYASRNYERAIAQWQNTLDLDANFFIAHRDLWRVFWLKGMYEKALDHCKQHFLLSDNRAVVEGIELAYAESGYKGAMDQAAQNLTVQANAKYVPPSEIALAYLHAEKKDQALEWLSKAYEGRDLRLYSIGMDPDWETLHSDSRFQILLQCLGLPQVTPK